MNCLEWLDGEYFPQNARRLRESYGYCKQRLEDIGVEVHAPKAGLFVWADFRKVRTLYVLDEGIMSKKLKRVLL